MLPDGVDVINPFMRGKSEKEWQQDAGKGRKSALSRSIKEEAHQLCLRQPSR